LSEKEEIHRPENQLKPNSSSDPLPSSVVSL
jgi:hypothetical protein